MTPIHARARQIAWGIRNGRPRVGIVGYLKRPTEDGRNIRHLDHPQGQVAVYAPGLVADRTIGRARTWTHGDEVWAAVWLPGGSVDKGLTLTLALRTTSRMDRNVTGRLSYLRFERYPAWPELATDPRRVR